MKDRQQVSSEVRKSRDEVDSPLDGRLTRNEDLEDDDDDEMIDLQANEEEECSITYDNKYGEGTDGNISEDESMWQVEWNLGKLYTSCEVKLSRENNAAPPVVAFNIPVAYFYTLPLTSMYLPS